MTESYRASTASRSFSAAQQRQLARALQDQRRERVHDAEHRHHDRHAEERVGDHESLVEDAHHLRLHLSVRERLKFDRADGPPIRFSAGQAYLAPHGDAEEAMRAADEAMYVEKGSTPGKLRRRV